MRKCASIISAALLFSLNLTAGDEIDQEIAMSQPENEIIAVAEPETEAAPAVVATTPSAVAATPAKKSEPFAAFTGKISKNKVRMRAQPSLEGKIIRELNKDEMVIITGETEDFYEVRPPDGVKAYIYRTYVLDNTIEGNHVNVRLEPDTDSPVVAQLNNGDKVNGTISPLHSKWMEITPPDSVHFFICKEYVEKIGDPSMMAQLDRRRNEVNQLLEATYALSRLEMQKDFSQIHLEDLELNLEAIITNYGDFHEQVGRAKALQQSLKEQYLQKKIAFLEVKAQAHPEMPPSDLIAMVDNTPNAKIDPRLSQWIPTESELYNVWAKENFDKSMSDFYEQERKKATVLSGIIQPYNRPVRNKPGDYVLLSRINRLPIAFLYSTVIDLRNFEEQEVTIKAASRPNHNFAFPAYFVLSVE